MPINIKVFVDEPLAARPWELLNVLSRHFRFISCDVSHGEIHSAAVGQNCNNNLNLKTQILIRQLYMSSGQRGAYYIVSTF